MYESDTHVRLSHGDVEVLPQQLWLPMWPLVHIIVVSGSQGLPTETRPHTEGKNVIRIRYHLNNILKNKLWYVLDILFHFPRQSTEFHEGLLSSFCKNVFQPGTTSVQLSLQPGSVRMLFVRRKTLIELVLEFITGGRK